MYGRVAFAMAAAQQAQNYENGLGYTLIDGQGRFFCGYRQPGGDVAFAGFRQTPNPGENPAIERVKGDSYSTAQPVFLSKEEMKEEGVAAAVFGVRSLVFDEENLPKEAKKEGKFGLVRKDLTYSPEAEPKRDWLTMPPISQPGLASAEACSQALDRGYVSLRKEFSASFQKAKQFVQRTFGLG